MQEKTLDDILVIQHEFVKHDFPISKYENQIINHIANRDPIAVKRLENFWTVGSASYKDKPLYSEHDYGEYVRKMNWHMMDAFKELYIEQLHFFEDLLSARCKYREDVSLPGFHAFRGCKAFEEPLARPHVDIPHNLFDWGQHSSYDTIFTHVTPVTIPQGAGMYVWPVTSEDISHHGIANIKQLLPEIEASTFLHEKDKLVKHSGRWLHQIKPFLPGQEGQWRITLQAHAILLDDVWNLYW